MAYIVGGSIKQVTANSAIFGQGNFYAAGDASGTLMAGGIITQDDAKVDGGGRLIVDRQFAPGSFELECTCDMAGANEQAFAVELQGDPATVWTIQHINGTIYSGTGSVVGTCDLDTMKSTFTLKVVGALGFTRQ